MTKIVFLSFCYVGKQELFRKANKLNIEIELKLLNYFLKAL